MTRSTLLALLLALAAPLSLAAAQPPEEDPQAEPAPEPQAEPAPEPQAEPAPEPQDQPVRQPRGQRPTEPAPIPRLQPPGALGADPARQTGLQLPSPSEAAEGSAFQLEAPTLDDPASDQALDEAIEEPWPDEETDGDFDAPLDDEGWDDGWDDEDWEEAEPLDDETAAALDEIGVTGEEGEHGEAHGPGAEHEDEEGGHHEAHFDFIKFSATVVNFFLWLAFVVWLGRKPISEYLKNRRLAVEEGIEEAKRLSAEAREKHAEYSARLERLDEELEKLRGEMIQAGEKESDRIIEDAEARAARMRRDAKFLVEQQMKQLRVDLTREAIEAAVSAAAEVLTKQVAPTDQQRLADTYLQEIADVMKDEEARA